MPRKSSFPKVTAVHIVVEQDLALKAGDDIFVFIGASPSDSFAVTIAMTDGEEAIRPVGPVVMKARLSAAAMNEACALMAISIPGKTAQDILEDFEKFHEVDGNA